MRLHIAFISALAAAGLVGIGSPAFASTNTPDVTARRVLPTVLVIAQAGTQQPASNPGTTGNSAYRPEFNSHAPLRNETTVDRPQAANPHAPLRNETTVDRPPAMNPHAPLK